MIQRFFSKYGLALHLAVLAALPLALTPFLTAATLCSVILWVSAFAAVWFFTEPSLRRGEHISTSRIRLQKELLFDPFTWFFLAVLAYALLRWLNNGIGMAYDPEQAAWLIRKPAWSGFPASAGAAGFLPFCVALAAALVVLGLRNGVGASARIVFGIIGAFVAGVGGLVAAILACSGNDVFLKATEAGFDLAPFWASSFGVWLVIGLACGAVAESGKWALARLSLIFSVAGNVAALVFFAPPLIAVGWFVFAVIALVFSLVVISQKKSMGAVARCSVLTVFGMAVPIFMVTAFMPRSFIEIKFSTLNPALAFSQAYVGMTEALTRIARTMWLANPWFGVGEGAFGLHLPFLAEKADWGVLALKPTFATNGYMMLLAERGVAGALVIVCGLGLQISSYVLRLIEGFKYNKERDEGGLFVFSVPPVAWILPFTLVLFAIEAWFSPIIDSTAFILTAAVPLSFAASSFPKARTSASAGSAHEAEHHHTHPQEH